MGFVTEGAQIIETGGPDQNLNLRNMQQVHLQGRAAEEAAIHSHREAERAASQSAEFARTAAERSAADAQATVEREKSRYNEELFRMTAEAANKSSGETHSSFPGATAGQIHSDLNTVLQPRDYAAEQDASFVAKDPSNIPQYGVNSPVVNYVTNIPTEDTMRTHLGADPTGKWATMGADINFGNISGSDAQNRLDLPDVPTHVSDVNLPLGTPVERSRPISEQSNQFRFLGAAASWFSNTRKLG